MENESRSRLEVIQQVTHEIREDGYATSAPVSEHTTLETSLPAVTGVDPEQLNGHQVPHIARPVFSMPGFARDALLHPGAAALRRREILRAGGPEADRIRAQNEEVAAAQPKTLAQHKELFKAPTSPVRRPA